GDVSAVVTEKGVVKTSVVVCAAGAWTSLFARNLSIDIPQLTVRSTVARTAAAPEVFAGNAASSDLAFRRRMDGGYTIALGDYHEHFISLDSFRYFRKFLPSARVSWPETRLRLSGGVLSSTATRCKWSGDDVSPFEKTRVLNPEPSTEALELMRARLDKRLPKLAGIPFEESWAGMIDTTPDVVPVMDEVTPRGLHIAAGFSGHGFGIGPGAGRVMADLVQGRPPGHDLKRFRFSRFSDGSPIELGPAL
ncbi:MAG: NAD(P)/FAD-dependent oxidoreductase, partial [Gammaproteobacteria bacterium]